jgi:hypothetical protein
MTIRLLPAIHDTTCIGQPSSHKSDGLSNTNDDVEMTDFDCKLLFSVPESVLEDDIVRLLCLDKVWAAAGTHSASLMVRQQSQHSEFVDASTTTNFANALHSMHVWSHIHLFV